MYHERVRHNSQHIDQVLSSRLIPFKRHAANVYMDQIFLMVRDAIIDKHDVVVERFSSRG